MEASNINIFTPSPGKKSEVDPWMQAIQKSKKVLVMSYWDADKAAQESVANVVERKQRAEGEVGQDDGHGRTCTPTAQHAHG